ncbi:hypothetical protein PHISCL_06260 [Aspergillus sclerotialis]|uniref:Uncharacterized protein n=1 Tax=Aspergillus sclerotialis TaxID=2070753 RepID=A0A3A2ZFL9_9EURO|nr:hypothetical protein PHISCL_06260 [Aspergillus sclerotialis]
MGAREEMEEVRPLVIERVSKMRIVLDHLNRIFRETKALEHTALTDRCLKDLGIKLSFLNLNEPSQDNSMIFYKPLPKEELPQVDWDHADFHDWEERFGYSSECRRVDLTLFKVTMNVWGQWFRNDKQQPWAHRKCYNEYPSIGTGEWGPYAPYEWQTHREIEGDEPFISHCSFSIIHYADPEEPLRRSEVLPIVAYMKWRMRQIIYLEHYTFLVLAVSIFRSKARILQAHYDGQHLQIFKSDFYDFKENIKENYELFVRWTYSIPCGDTFTPLCIEGEKLEDPAIRRLDKFLKKVYKVK